MTLLINGCSFAQGWHNPSEKFLQTLGCFSVTNISKVATSFQRTYRSTIEWIAQNGTPEFVIVAVPYVTRWELSVAGKEDVLDGTWYPIQISTLNNVQDLSTMVDDKKFSSMVENYYGCIPDIRTYWDKFFIDLIGFSSFLSQHQIKHVFFDMCNNFDSKHIKNFLGFDKIKFIKSNDSIIDLFSFCGNKHIYDCLTTEKQKQIHPYSHHHSNDDFVYLENYLINYINSCKIL